MKRFLIHVSTYWCGMDNTFRAEADASLNIEKIGYFCADAGMVAVFLLDEVLKYNPDFDYHINREWTTTLIKDFDGEINYYVDDDAHIIGVGNVNFFTTQTGF